MTVIAVVKMTGRVKEFNPSTKQREERTFEQTFSISAPNSTIAKKQAERTARNLAMEIVQYECPDTPSN